MPRSPRVLASLCLAILLGLLSASSGVFVAHAQSGASCVELVRNGGFEYVGDWELGASTAQPQYVSDNRHSGNWALLLGINDGVNRDSYSSARQLVTIPAGAGSAALSFWYYAYADGAPTTDYMELVLLAPDGYTVIEKPWFSRNDSRAWNQMTVNLDAYRGRSLYLYFNVRNDGAGGIARMHLDDVSLAACGSGGGGGVITPPIVITPGPVVTGSPGAPTPTRDACPNPILPCDATRTPTPSTVAPTAPLPSATPVPPAPTLPPVVITPDIPQPVVTLPPTIITPDAGVAPEVIAPPGAEVPASGGEIVAGITRIAIGATAAPPADLATRSVGVAIPRTATPTAGFTSALSGITKNLPKYWWVVPLVAVGLIVFLFWLAGRQRRTPR
jgi:hypothetical protein